MRDGKISTRGRPIFYIHHCNLTAFSMGGFFSVVTSAFVVICASFLRGRERGGQGCNHINTSSTCCRAFISRETKVRSGNPANNVTREDMILNFGRYGGSDPQRTDVFEAHLPKKSL